jgi:hypothetical protein
MPRLPHRGFPPRPDSGRPKVHAPLLKSSPEGAFNELQNHAQPSTPIGETPRRFTPGSGPSGSIFALASQGDQSPVTNRNTSTSLTLAAPLRRRSTAGTVRLHVNHIAPITAAFERGGVGFVEVDGVLAVLPSLGESVPEVDARETGPF